MHKCIYESAPVHLVNKIVRTEHTHEVNTRAAASGVIQIPQPNNELFKTSLNYQGAKIWNNLPSELRSVSDIDEFRFFYKQLFFKRNRISVP